MTIYPIGEMTRIAELFGEFGMAFAALLVVLVIGIDFIDDALEHRAVKPAAAKPRRSRLARLYPARAS